ncbi:MAG: class D beta-lactamase [Pseudomonadota bacterium]|nr:class D beta-lactamase [Pseudomonadota bacterium]
MHEICCRRIERTFAPFLICAAAGLAFTGQAVSASADNVCTVLADAPTGAILRQSGECNRRVPPASTFKVAIALMGYDAGFLKDETDPTLPFKEGYPDWVESWRTDTDPAAWMKNSVVWYSQQVTQALGMEKFAGYVSAFGYGNEDVSGDAGKDNGLKRSWLSSSLRISPLEQIDFLTKIIGRKFPVSAHAYEMTATIQTAFELPDGWTVRGKTGAGYSVNADGSPDRRRPFGWFVGWATKGDRTIVFARLSEFSSPQKMSPGLGTRDALLKELPSMLDAF